MQWEPKILPETVGLRLCKIVKEELQLFEEFIFTRGRIGVVTTLNRASISGEVGGDFGQPVYWADQLNSDGDVIGEIRLDRQSWNSLKNNWMRCKRVS